MRTGPSRLFSGTTANFRHGVRCSSRESPGFQNEHARESLDSSRQQATRSTHRGEPVTHESQPPVNLAVFDDGDTDSSHNSPRPPNTLGHSRPTEVADTCTQLRTAWTQFTLRASSVSE
ncbi:hypothetical protein MRX96_006405 [Rhipicephalus microplus]